MRIQPQKHIIYSKNNCNGIRVIKRILSIVINDKIILIQNIEKVHWKIYITRVLKANKN